VLIRDCKENPVQDNSRVRSRLAQALLAAAALIAMGNGLVMLIDPLGCTKWPVP
jgi:hypothetical protein